MFYFIWIFLSVLLQITQQFEINYINDSNTLTNFYGKRNDLVIITKNHSLLIDNLTQEIFAKDSDNIKLDCFRSISMFLIFQNDYSPRISLKTKSIFPNLSEVLQSR